MDRGCLLAVQGEGMFGEDYQVFLSDGRPVGQVLVLGHSDPAAGGKQGVHPTSDSTSITSFQKAPSSTSVTLLQKPLSAPTV